MIIAHADNLLLAEKEPKILKDTNGNINKINILF